jgi:hypothetical protein
MRHPFRRPRWIALLAGVLLAGVPAHQAAAQCSPLTLLPGVPQSSSSSPANLQFSLPVGTFVAVGARSAAGSNHALGAYANNAGSPTCVSGVLATSANAAGTVEVVLGDYRPGHNPAGTRYGQAVRAQGTGAATFELETTARPLLAGQPPDSLEPAPAVLDLYQVFLEAGNAYTINFSSAGAVQRTLLFQNPGSASYWGARGGSGMLLDVDAPTVFVAPASTDYALAVVNENGAAGTYALWVELCQPPDTLASTVAVPAVYPHRNVMLVEDPYWQAVGIRSDAGADWNVAVYDTGRGSPEPVCFGGLLAPSNRANGVDFVVGDLSSGPVRPYFARETRAAGTGGARIEWDGGPDEIAVGDTLNPILRTTGPDDVLEVWDVRMNPAEQYTIRFQPSGAAALRWFLLDNPNQGPGGAVWKGRDQSVLEGTGFASYTPTSDTWHALVVVNENGAAGSYTLTVVAGSAVGVGPDGADATALGRIAPNPLAGGAARIAYALAGRRVARIDAGERPAGAGAVTWDGRGEEGTRLGAGVYFARLFVDEAAFGAARMVLVR